MGSGLCCPRCGRHNSSQARFCANCGLSFLSAGLISQSSGGAERNGSGLLGVIVGFILIFALVAVISFIRLAAPPRVHFSSEYAPVFQYEQVRMGPHQQDRLIRRDTHWRFEFPVPSSVGIKHGKCGE